MAQSFEVKNRFEALILREALSYYIGKLRNAKPGDRDLEAQIGAQEMLKRLDAIMYPSGDAGWKVNPQ